uniref:Uncharacterized protein n=1 Tax=Vitis vinifera TaxID=29760 RepID=F6HSI5_VITVI
MVVVKGKLNAASSRVAGDQKNLKSVGLSFEVYSENERVNIGSRDSVGPSSTGNLCSSTKGLLRAIQVIQKFL